MSAGSKSIRYPKQLLDCQPIRRRRRRRRRRRGRIPKRNQNTVFHEK